MDSNRSISRMRISRLRAAKGSSISSRASQICSLARRIEARGVRSSWETSETNSLSIFDSFSQASIWASSEAAISLKERDSVAISSSPWTGRRSLRRPPANRWEAREVRRMGIRTRQVSAQIPRMSMSRNPDPAITTAREASSITFCSGARV